MTPPRTSPPPLWLCADLSHPRAKDPDALLARLTAIAATTPFTLWIRTPPEHPARSLAALTRRALALSKTTDVRVLVGDRLDVAIAAGAHGVHLPERSLSPDVARSLARSLGRDDLWISCAAHDELGLLRAETYGDSATLSPFRDVADKGEPLEVEGFRSLRACAPTVPVLALGGIQRTDDARDAMRAGASGIVVRRAWLECSDPAAMCGALALAISAPG